MEKEPFPVIESERLILKPHLDNKEYAELLYNKIMDSKDHLFRFLPKLWKLKSVDDEISFLTHSKEEWEKMVTANYAIYLKSTNEVVGTLGVMDISYDNDNAEIGYMLFKDHVHKGYMVEAVKAAESAFFKRGMNKIQIRMDVENTPSERVVLKCKYVYEGTQRNQEKNPSFGNTYRSLKVYTKLRSEWERE